MGAETGISWTDSTWNPITGCSKISAGCLNCYASKLSERNLPAVGKWGPDAERIYSVAAWNHLPTWSRQAGKAGKIRTVFCASLADMFEGEHVGTVTYDGLTWTERRDGPRPGHLEVLLRLAEESPRYPWLRFLMLSKRPWNQRIFAERHGWPVTWWQGISTEDQPAYDERLPHVVPGARVFLSVEPMIGPVVIRDPVDWVVAGSESGPHARSASIQWFENLLDQCRTAGIPFHFKQHLVMGKLDKSPLLQGAVVQEFPDVL